jgi:hypothetical protein
MTAGSSLGFHPSRVLQRKPWLGFRPASSHALRGLGKAEPAGAPESRSASARPHPCAVPRYGPDKATLLGFLHRLDPIHSSEFLAGLWIRLSLCRALLPTYQWSLANTLALPELSGPAEVPSTRDLNVAKVMNARGALQSLRSCCSTLGVTTSGRPLGIGRPSRVSSPPT